MVSISEVWFRLGASPRPTSAWQAEHPAVHRIQATGQFPRPTVNTKTGRSKRPASYFMLFLRYEQHAYSGSVFSVSITRAGGYCAGAGRFFHGLPKPGKLPLKFHTIRRNFLCCADTAFHKACGKPGRIGEFFAGYDAAGEYRAEQIPGAVEAFGQLFRLIKKRSFSCMLAVKSGGILLHAGTCNDRRIRAQFQQASVVIKKSSYS